MMPTNRLLAVVLLVSLPALAQGKGPATPEDVDKDVASIPWKKGEAFKGGRLLYVDGSSDGVKPVRYGLEGVGITQPISVSILTRPAVAKVKLTAVKWGSASPGTQVETDARGAASLSFRVQGDAQLIVQGPKATFQVMVWVGPELKPPLKPPFTAAKAEALRAGKGGGK